MQLIKNYICAGLLLCIAFYHPAIGKDRICKDESSTSEQNEIGSSQNQKVNKICNGKFLKKLNNTKRKFKEGYKIDRGFKIFLYAISAFAVFFTLLLIYSMISGFTGLALSFSSIGIICIILAIVLLIYVLTSEK